MDDLNIFGRRGGSSVLQLFNRAVTRGGSDMLEELFRQPLSDAAAINRRSGTMQFFSHRREAFPFRGSGLDAIEAYLSMTDERTRLPAEQASLNGRLTALIGSDNVYKVVHQGIVALVDVVGTMQRFLETLGPGPYAEEATEIIALLNSPALSPLQRVAAGSKLSYAQVAEWDGLLRFRHRAVVKQLLRSVYLLDVYIAVAQVAGERGFCYVEALAREEGRLWLEGCYHPQLQHPVPNDLCMTADSNVLFLTGANMAGKSTLMKSLGIALYLAHLGFPVAARRMVFAVRDGLYTTINLPDNLGMGASHFYAEVLRVKKMAVELRQGRQLFIVFDELFRGTNVKDAHEATVAITSAFARKRGSMFVISTHIIEAGDELRRSGNIHFVYLPTRMEGTVPTYPYTLEDGITADRHGMIIIQNEGILDILRRATL